MPQTQITTNASPATTGRIDTSYAGWFRALKPVDSIFQSWECVGWFKSREEAERALKQLSVARNPEGQQTAVH